MKNKNNVDEPFQWLNHRGSYNHNSRIFAFFFTALLLLCLNINSVSAQNFAHPGLLQGAEDFQRMKAAIDQKTEPIYSGFVALKDHPQSQSTYKMQGPLEMVGRNPTIGQTAYDADANAAYQNAVMWALTGDQKFAAKAIEIVNAWSSTLRSITGRDAVLMAGLGPFKMVNAAEILRYTGSGWSQSDAQRAEQHFRTVIFPVIKDFAPFANGNWDSAAMKTMLAIAVFTNDRVMFEKALVYYANGAGDGGLNNYIVNESGQCQESGRDQAHTQLGIAHLADFAEIAWHQGLDVYGLDHDLLLKGFEYTAKFNLGSDVPYVPEMDRTGKYYHAKIAEEGRGKLRAIYEEVYNHYTKRMGRQAPFTAQAAEKVRPELQTLPGADHIGFGTLLYSRAGMTGLSRREKTATPAPGGLFAYPSMTGLRLSWIPVIGARSYAIARAGGAKAQFRVIASGIMVPHYEDKQVRSGSHYRYRVTALSDLGKSGDAATIGITAGLPGGWKYAQTSWPAGELAYGDGDQLIIEAKGAGMSPVLVHQLNMANPTITLRYVPQISSQFTSFGVSFIRSGQASPVVSLLVSPRKSSQVEAPDWSIQFRSKKENTDSLMLRTAYALPEPVVTFSRLTGYCWLKLEYQKGNCAAFYSADGTTWLPAGSIPLTREIFDQAGIFVNSGLQAVTTNVNFDHVTIR